MKSSGLILFACAGFLFSGGTILGGTVAWNLLRMSYYFWTTDLGIEIAASILFVAGSLLCLPTCWLATLVPHTNNKTTTVSAALLGVVSVAMLLLSLGMASMSALAQAVREPATLNSSMLRAMTVDSYDLAVRSSFAAMQIERGDSCDVATFSSGCLYPALVELRAYANTLTTLSSALVVIMAVTMFATVYILVTNELGRGKLRSFKTVAPVRIGVACLPQAPFPPPVSGSLLETAMPPIGNTM